VPPEDLRSDPPQDVILRVEALSKKRSRSIRKAAAQGLGDILREATAAAPSPALRPGEFWALRDVTVELRRGESLAVIGANGAGKSTLLKILYGLLKPDTGSVFIRGRVQAILDLGAAFHPLATGREAIDLAAALEGLSGPAARTYRESVIAFAELDGAIDTAVQNFSTGMKARLAFGIAACLDPDLLLVDEVLAVGDLDFQIKCIEYTKDFLRRGGAMVFVSHSSHQVQSACNRGVMLTKGQVSFEGSAIETLNHMFESRAAGGQAPPGEAAGDSRLLITSVSAEAVSGGDIYSGSSIRLKLRYRAGEAMSVQWGFGIWTPDLSICVCGDFDETVRQIEPGTGEFSCVLPAVSLSGGRFAIRAGLVDAVTGFPLAYWGYANAATQLLVKETPGRRALSKLQANQLVDLQATWEH
jgi:ABC-type polysaccharide/polyol phosphate transport system ATPase subunit